MEQSFTFDNLYAALEKSEGYMIGVTILDRGNLRHYLLTKNFPRTDLLMSHNKVKSLAIEELEKPEEVAGKVTPIPFRPKIQPTAVIKPTGVEMIPPKKKEKDAKNT